MKSFSTRKEVKNGCYLRDGKFVFVKNGSSEEICTINDSSLNGEHNYANTLAVLTVAKELQIENDKIVKALKTFPGVEHRLEFVRELNGVKYINDSKATNVDAVWYALRSFDQSINLILGGTDKGNDYNQILEPVQKNVKRIYAVGSSAQKVYDFFNETVEVKIVESYEECVKQARIDALQNEVVLLSPACASFDMFKSYEHRGEVFKKLVNELK